MEITLEKIELVKDRTGVSYKEAKDALEKADGSVVDAIIDIEESLDHEQKRKITERGSSIIDAVKGLVKKGNVSKIVVRKKDGEVILNIPVNAGLIAAILAPSGILISTVAAFGFRCTIEVVKSDGTVIDVSDKANDAFDKVVEKGGDIKEAAVQKGHEVKEKVHLSVQADKEEKDAEEKEDTDAENDGEEKEE